MLHYKYKQILGFLEGNNVTSMSFSVSKNNITLYKKIKEWKNIRWRDMIVAMMLYDFEKKRIDKIWFDPIP